jgi:hypothetical protein
MGSWKNSDGLMVRYGREQGKREASSGTGAGAQRAAAMNNRGSIKELVLEVDLEGAARTTFTADRNNDGTLDGFMLGLDTPIPANAKILSVESLVLETPAGGTTFQLGTFQVDGTAIDDDGLTAASATAVGAAGAQVGTKIAEAGYVAVKTVGTYTAGKVVFVIRFLSPPATIA